MEKIKLTVEPRTVLGKKVKTLRKSGLLPANIFGKDLKSKSVQLDEKEFRKVFKQSGETGIVEVKLKEEIYPSLIHNIQTDPVTDKIIHADFHKINLKEKINANVPLKLVGESPAEKSSLGLVLQTISELEVECLPADIPHEIEIDISKLEEVGQTIHIKDLKIDKEKVEVKTDLEAVIVSVQNAEMKEEVVEEVATPADVEATAEKDKEDEEVSEGEGKKEEKATNPPADGESPDKPQE